MTREEILDKLKLILKHTMPDAEDLIGKMSESSDLHTDIGLNSVGMLYIVIAIEEMFNIEFDCVEFKDFNTVADVIDYIAERTDA